MKKNLLWNAGLAACGLLLLSLGASAFGAPTGAPSASVEAPSASASAPSTPEAPRPVSDVPPPPAKPSAELPAGGASADPLKVYVLTFSPGDHPFFKFGHNAIMIRDERLKNPSQRDRVYNYGMFSFGDPMLIPKFFQGRFMYWMQSDGLPAVKIPYRRENRFIEVAELDFSPEEKAELQRLLQENAKEENKYYKYDYYQDNCSTRVRDMIDRVAGGRVREASTGPARLTYRGQTLRLTADFVAENVILNFIMGDFIDQPMTRWEESFVPMEFQRTLRTVTLPNGDGTFRPIVKHEEVMLEAPGRVPPPEEPPTLWPYALLSGLGLGGLFAVLGHLGRKVAPARVLYGLLLSIVGFLAGFFGLFFLAAWAFTDHRVGYHNENMLLAVPWAIVLTGTGINVARARVGSILRAYKLVAFALGATMFATVAKVLPWFDQQNGFFLLFFVPLWAGVFFGVWRLKKTLAEPALRAT